jgi:hypothetical protein
VKGEQTRFRVVSQENGLMSRISKDRTEEEYCTCTLSTRIEYRVSLIDIGHEPGHIEEWVKIDAKVEQ